MKKIRIIPIIALFSVMLASCPDLNPKDPEGETFWAQDLKKGSFYKLKAKMLYAGAHCEVWAETGSGVTKAMAENIAHEYDNKIRPRVVDVFSAKNFNVKDDNGSTHHFADTLDFANALTGRDNKKLTVLLLDIRDGFQNEATDPYVAGYFYSGDFLPKKGQNIINNNIYYSNVRDMIYVDTNPGLRNESTQAQVYSTFAHELQHLVNFVTTVLIDRKDDNGNPVSMDIWVNEGLSAYAEYLYLDKNPRDKCAWLIDDRNTIYTGNNFFVWDNYKDISTAILDDYATVYLFFRWLHLRNSGSKPGIFFDIVNSKYYDYRAVTSVVGGNWETLLKAWLTANYNPQSGYAGDAELQQIIEIDPIYIQGNKKSLFPGEGVYSVSNGSSHTSTGNIRYAELTGNTRSVRLTFNANPDNKAGVELGSLTGVSASVASPTAAGNARQAGKWNGPYVIDAQDMLGRNQDMPIPVRIRR